MVKNTKQLLKGKYKFGRVTLLLFVAAFAAIGFLTLNLTFAAGKGGKPQASILFSPNPATVGTDYTVSGTGFGANKWVTVGATYGEWPYWVSVITDGNGNFIVTHQARSAGQIYHEVKEQRNNGSLVLKATGTLTVN